MITIDRNKITISKGDNVVLNMSIKVDGVEYTLQDGDYLTFSISCCGRKVFDKILEGKVLELSSAETATLNENSYLYDILLTYASGERKTVCFPTDFIVKGVCYED